MESRRLPPRARSGRAQSCPDPSTSSAVLCAGVYPPVVEHFGYGGSNCGGRLYSQPILTDTSTHWSATAGRHSPLGRYCPRVVPDRLIRGRLGNGGSIGMRPRFSLFISAVLASLYSYILHFPLVFLIASPTRAREKIKEAPGTAFSADRFTAKHLNMLGLFGVHISTRRANKEEKIKST